MIHAFSDPTPAGAALVVAEPIMLDYATSASRPGRAVRLARLAAWATCAVGTGAIFVRVESVIATGPLLFALGAVMVGVGHFCRRSWLAVLGAMHAGVCLLFVVLVNLRSWSPDEAEVPFRVMSVLYCIPATLLMASQAQRPRR